VAKVRDVGAYRVTGKKTNKHAERGCANSERNFLICHGDQKATSRPEEQTASGSPAISNAAQKASALGAAIDG
jgi:hypothetical protein